MKRLEVSCAVRVARRHMDNLMFGSAYWFLYFYVCVVLV
jgi:hypothetical protein